jgi:hypothetical protein
MAANYGPMSGVPKIVSISNNFGGSNPFGGMPGSEASHECFSFLLFSIIFKLSKAKSTALRHNHHPENGVASGPETGSVRHPWSNEKKQRFILEINYNKFKLQYNLINAPDEPIFPKALGRGATFKALRGKGWRGQHLYRPLIITGLRELQTVFIILSEWSQSSPCGRIQGS